MLSPGPLADPPISFQSSGTGAGGVGVVAGEAAEEFTGGGGGAGFFRSEIPRIRDRIATTATAPSKRAFPFLPARRVVSSASASEAEAVRDSGSFSRSRRTTRSVRGWTFTTLEGGL